MSALAKWLNKPTSVPRWMVWLISLGTTTSLVVQVGKWLGWWS
jgi:hypothetical protein